MGFTVFPKTANVKVTAIKPGTDGNVEPNTIVVIPKGEDPISLDVVNPDETSGGKHDEFPKVSQKDVDAALAALEPALQAAFAARLEDPSIASPGATVFPETGVLGVPVPTVDPASLVDQEVPSFDLGLNATGTVTAVNPGPVETVAAERLRSTIDSGHRLVENSIKVAVDPAVVSGDQISFPATATATQVAILDPDALKAMVIGRPLDEARSILEAFGQVRARGLAGLGVDGADARRARHADPRRGRAGRDAGTDGEPMTRLLGIDLGERRVGVALADGDASPARPLVTLRRARDTAGDAAGLRALVEAHGIDELVVGLPARHVRRGGRAGDPHPGVGGRGRRGSAIAGNLSRRAPDQPPRRGPSGSDEARPVGRPPDSSATRRLPGTRRSRSGGHHPPG